MNEGQRRVYLSLENYEYLKPEILRIKGIEKRIYGNEEVELILLEYDENIILEKRINRRDQDTLTLVLARYKTIIDKPVKIKKVEWKGRPILTIQPLSLLEEEMFGGEKK